MSSDADGTPQTVPSGAISAVSDTGAVVVYDTLETSEVDPDGVARVWVRDRVGSTSRPVAEVGSIAPGLSANGCLVAYSVIGTEGADASLTVVDRCTAAADAPLPIGTAIDTVDLPGEAALDDVVVEESTDDAVVDESTDDAVVDESIDGSPGDGSTAAGDSNPGLTEPPVVVGVPALSFDGSVIVWSTGREIRRYERPGVGEAFVRTHTVDVSTTPSPDVATAARVDVSADGRTVVYSAGPGAEAFSPTPANVYVWESSTPATEPELLSSSAIGEPGADDSTSPSISADGSFVVFESSSVDLAALGDSTVVVPAVVGVDLSARAAQVLVDDATRPAISADGLHVAYQRGDAILVLSSIDGVLADSADPAAPADPADPADPGPDELADAQPTGPLALSRHGRWLVFAGATDLRADPTVPLVGAGVWAADRSSSEPDVVDTTTTSTTTSTTSTTVPSRPPTTSTTITTSTQPDSSTVTSSTTTSPTTSTTTVDATTSSTVPATTLPATPILDRFPTNPGTFPRVVVPSRPAPRPATNRSVTTSMRPPTVPELDPIANPVVFEPTVIDAGRRVQPATLFNASRRTIDVTAASVDATGPFSIVSDGCAGLRLAAAASCSIDVEFAPSDVGPTTSFVSFALADGTVVTATLDGQGVPEPTLELVPAVAGTGQTVTVFGAGFPAGSTLELTQPGDALVHPVVVDPDGTFAHVIVILPNTPTGPGAIDVAGQRDLFGDVATELLVSSRGSTSNGAALRSSVGTPTRR